MSSTTITRTVHVVRDLSGRFVLAFWGDDEATRTEQEAWSGREGYVVTTETD